MRERSRKPTRLRAAFIASCSLVMTFCAMQNALAETDKLRIAQQFGIAYLPLIVSNEKGYIEEEARKLGIQPPTIEWLRLSGAAAMNAKPSSPGVLILLRRGSRP